MTVDGAGAEDRAAILDVLARFAHGIDGRDWALYRSVFTDAIDVDYTSYRAGSAGRMSADDWVARARRLFPGLDATQHSLVNPLATMVLSTINPDVAFVGCNGVHAQRGVTNVNLPEAEVKREMLAAARRRVIVADGSKLGEVAAVNLCPVTDVGVVITGQSAPRSVLDDLASLGVDVEVAV